MHHEMIKKPAPQWTGFSFTLSPSGLARLIAKMISLHAFGCIISELGNQAEILFAFVVEKT